MIYISRNTYEKNAIQITVDNDGILLLSENIWKKD